MPVTKRKGLHKIFLFWMDSSLMNLGRRSSIEHNSSWSDTRSYTSLWCNWSGTGWVCGTESIVTLIVHMNTTGVNLSWTPGGSRRLSSIDPLSAAVVSDSWECEGEHTSLSCCRSTGCSTCSTAAASCGGCCCCGSGCCSCCCSWCCDSGGAGYCWWCGCCWSCGCCCWCNSSIDRTSAGTETIFSINKVATNINFSWTPGSWLIFCGTFCVDLALISKGKDTSLSWLRTRGSGAGWDSDGLLGTARYLRHRAVIPLASDHITTGVSLSCTPC